MSSLHYLNLLLGESYRDRVFSLCGPLANIDSCVLKDMEIIGPSISEVRTGTSCGLCTSISMKPAQLGVHISKSISEAIQKLQANLPINL